MILPGIIAKRALIAPAGPGPPAPALSAKRASTPTAYSEDPAHRNELSRWAAEFESTYEVDPEDEPELAWASLVRRQGRAELARTALLRLLDDAGPRDASQFSLGARWVSV